MKRWLGIIFITLLIGKFSFEKIRDLSKKEISKSKNEVVEKKESKEMNFEKLKEKVFILNEDRNSPDR